MFKLVLEKAEEPEIKLPTSAGSSKKRESFRKTSTAASLTTLKSLTVWITTNCGKFFQRWEYQTTWPASWEICMHVRKQQLEPDIEQQTGSKLGKEDVIAVYCHPASVQFNSVAQLCPILPPHGLQHTRPTCPSPTPGACSKSCPSSQWCHPTISSSVIPFSSHLQSFPA